MAYAGYYNNVRIGEIPLGSRQQAKSYPGSICPIACDFGKVHGTSAARGSVKFRGAIPLPVSTQVVLQVGQSVFYGLSFKAEVEGYSEGGIITSVSLVDMRDRLHDVYHYAQYNMHDDEGIWWHIMPDQWMNQVQYFMTNIKAEDVVSNEDEYKIYGRINDLGDLMPSRLFNAGELMKLLAAMYGFTFSWSASAERPLTEIPDNLDFNSGTKVIDCIEAILSTVNLQFTAWGDLHIHITERGRADTAFEEAILSGLVNLCELNRLKDASLGTEINEGGRRVNVIGGRNKYEYWYPCYPDWNDKWDFELVTGTGVKLAALLEANKCFMTSPVADLPVEYWDTRPGPDGKTPRFEMTIQEYIDTYPYRSFVADMRERLVDVTKKLDHDNPNVRIEEEFRRLALLDSEKILAKRRVKQSQATVRKLRRQIKTTAEKLKLINDLTEYRETLALLTHYRRELNRVLKESGTFDFHWELWFDTLNLLSQSSGSDAWFNKRFSSPFPVVNLVSNYDKQFLAMGPSKKLSKYRQDVDINTFLKGDMLIIEDGVTMEVEEVMLDRSYDDEEIQIKNPWEVYRNQRSKDEADKGNKGYIVRLSFSEMMYTGEGEAREAEVPVPKDNNPNDVEIIEEIHFEVKPPRIYVKICTEEERFVYEHGHPMNAPRVRTINRNIDNIFMAWNEGIELPMFKGSKTVGLTELLNDYELITAEEIAEFIAVSALNHEFITSSGSLSFAAQAGFMPSGIIDSVRVQFNPTRSRQSGAISEAVNFTNIKNDSRVPKYFGVKRTLDLRNLESRLEKSYINKMNRQATLMLNNPPRGKDEDKVADSIDQKNNLGNQDNSSYIGYSREYIQENEIMVGNIIAVQPDSPS